jgi:hypothetical protein
MIQIALFALFRFELIGPGEKKTGHPHTSGQPGHLLSRRSVAFRPRLATGLAFSVSVIL